MASLAVSGPNGPIWPVQLQTLVIGHLKNTIILFVCLPKFCTSIVFIFSWDDSKSQEKMKAMFMQNFGGQAKSIMVFLKWPIGFFMPTANKL